MLCVTMLAVGCGCAKHHAAPERHALPSAGGWSGSFDVARVPDRAFAKVAVDARGTALLAWVSGGRVQTRSRSPATGALGPIVAVSELGARRAQVAVAPAGDAIICWSRRHDVDGRVQARTRGADGTLGPILDVAAPGDHAADVRASVAGNGVAVLAWTARRGRGSATTRVEPTRIVARSLSAGHLARAVDVAALDAGRSWQVGVAGDATAFFVWERGRHTNRRVYARVLSASGLQRVFAVSSARSRAILPQLTVTADGRALVVWTYSVPGASDDELDRVQGRWLSKTGRPIGPIIDISTRAPNPDPRAADDHRVGAVITWTQTRVSGDQHVVARSLSRSGRLGRAVTIAPGPRARNAKVATAADGTQTFVWLASDAAYSHSQLRTRSRSATAGLGPVHRLTSSPQGDIWPEFESYPQLAVAASGATIVTWTHKAADAGVAQAAASP
jgi:hypothetical protein